MDGSKATSLVAKKASQMVGNWVASKEAPAVGEWADYSAAWSAYMWDLKKAGSVGKRVGEMAVALVGK